MSQNKTQPTKASVKTFLGAIIPEQKQKDSFKLYALMKKITGTPFLPAWLTVLTP